MNYTSKKGVFQYFWIYTKGIKRFFILALITTFICILFGFLAPQVIRITVDSVIGEEPFALPDFLISLLQFLGGRDTLRANLYICALGVLLCTIVEGLGSLVSRLFMSHCTELYLKRLRDAIFRHIQHLPFSWHTSHQTGDIIQRCTSDMDVIRNFISNQLLEAVRILILVTTAIYLMATMNMKLTLIALIFIPIIALYSGIFFSKISKQFRKADEAEGELMVTVQENLTGVRVVRAFGRERYELQKFERGNKTFHDLWVNMGYTLGAYWGLGDLVTGAQVLTIIVAGAYFAYLGRLTLGEFLVFVSYNQTLAFPLRRLGRILSDLSKMRVSAERLAEILAADEEKDSPSDIAPQIKGDISFENVTFAYDGADVLKNVSFDIPAGTTFGILGNTGSGKSTISYLIDRLYDLPQDSGTIKIDGIDTRNIKRSHLRKNVGIVLQEPFLFSKTIADNISIARPFASMEDIRNTAGSADIDEDITGFSKGYDTIVGERGVTLSGGQKQRVAIARTLMCDCPIMVFDDSLSAVDLETDAKIRAALKENTGKATVVLISHRINTLMDSDCIMVLENGKVAEVGSHNELMANEGTYRRTYDIQSAAAGKGPEEDTWTKI
ncbi:MAG: ABC transporter ATP-binding protein [Clostridiaceae bacterium]|nr:ABC transporter ATP-binding protein [Clostridiaceae bacterium]